MKLLVTGGSGFLGSRVLPLLVHEGHDVKALARSAEAATRVGGLGATPIEGDLDDPESIDAAFARSSADGLVNLASLGFGHAPTIVAAAEEAGLRRSVFISTTAIFTTLNARSKEVRCAAERTIQASTLQWTILRPTMIYGARGDRNMARLLQLVRLLPVIPVPGGGGHLQQPVHVDDLAAAIVAAVGADDAIGNAYNVAGPAPAPLREIIEQACDAAGRRARLVSVPLVPAVIVAGLYERIVANPRFRAEQFQRLAENKAYDIEPARRDLGFDPRPFQTGIEAQARALDTAPPSTV